MHKCRSMPPTTSTTHSIPSLLCYGRLVGMHTHPTSYTTRGGTHLTARIVSLIESRSRHPHFLGIRNAL
jgi:hypothetical protein